MLRKAGIKVKRTVLPGSTFWNDWVKYPYSSTNWNHRPLGVQILGLAYRSGEAMQRLKKHWPLQMLMHDVRK